MICLKCYPDNRKYFKITRILTATFQQKPLPRAIDLQLAVKLTVIKYLICTIFAFS